MRKIFGLFFLVIGVAEISHDVYYIGMGDVEVGHTCISIIFNSMLAMGYSHPIISAVAVWIYPVVLGSILLLKISTPTR